MRALWTELNTILLKSLTSSCCCVFYYTLERSPNATPAATPPPRRWPGVAGRAVIEWWAISANHRARMFAVATGDDFEYAHVVAGGPSTYHYHLTPPPPTYAAHGRCNYTRISASP